MMNNMHKPACAALRDIAQGITPEAYTNIIWTMRYPMPEPKASTGWPMQRIGSSK